MVELNRRFRWFLLLRFGAVLCLLLLAFIKYLFIPQISASHPILVRTAVILFLLNICYWYHYKRLEKRRDPGRYSRGLTHNIQAQMILDFLVLGYLVYLFGGIESPLIYLFLIHVILACLFFGRAISLLYVLVSILIITVISLGTYFGFIPPQHFMKGMIIGNFYKDPIYFHSYYWGMIFIYLAIWYVVSSITDNLKEQECMLQEKIEEMVKMDEEKTRYMLTTTHELKAPFAAIQSYVNLALGGYVGDISKDVKEILLRIKDRCDRLMNMIIDMLRLTNLKSLKDKPVIMSEVNLSEVILGVLKIFEDKARERSLIFEPLNLDWASYKIMANREQLEILLANVISNAVNYSYPQNAIKIWINEKDGKVIVVIEDHGIGIKKEHLPKVFLEYFRSEKAVEMNKNSTGLGLAAAKQIMDIHHGRIWIESKEGKGTKVSMEFPKGI